MYQTTITTPTVTLCCGTHLSFAAPAARLDVQSDGLWLKIAYNLAKKFPWTTLEEAGMLIAFDSSRKEVYGEYFEGCTRYSVSLWDLRRCWVEEGN